MKIQTGITAEDEKTISYWLKVYKKQCVLCICALVPVLPLIFIPLLGNLPIEALAIIMLILVAIITGCTWKLTIAIKHYGKAKAILNSGFIETITGTLQDLKAIKYNLLQYQIENETITLTAQESFDWKLRIVSTQSLQNIPVRLHILPISDTKNILLYAVYKDNQHITCSLQDFTDEEKERKQRDFKILIGVAISICMVTLILAFIALPSEDWLSILLIWATLLVAFIITFHLSKFKLYYFSTHKTITTGTVSEVIVIRYRSGQRNPRYYNRYCYRLGRQMVLGRDVPVEDNKWKDDIVPGDMVTFEHCADKKGQRGAFISVSKTAFN